MKKGKTILLTLASVALITSLIYDKKNKNKNKEQDNLEDDKTSLNYINF